MERSEPRTDGDLLAAFSAGRDERAFEEVVRRHEALVFNVCARVLVDGQDARDAAQAVFLVLARKAGRIDLGRPVAPWLHHVATAVALNARRDREVRREKERKAVEHAMRDPHPSDDLRPILDRELDGLPDRYRRPLVLFHFEGKTLEETAEELGSPVGTVGSWLARGREMLRDRLVRRGVTGLTGAALLALLAGEASARSAGFAFARAAVGAGASPHVLSLAKGALDMLFLAKLKSAALALGAAGLALAANLALFTRAESVPPAAAAVSPFVPEPEPAVIVAAPPAEPETAPSGFARSSDLVGHWTLDDGKAVDASGRGGDGVLKGGPVGVDGKRGGALKFDGKIAHVELPATDDLSKVQEGSYSLAAWFRPDGVPPGTESANDESYGIVLKTGWHLGLQYNHEKKFIMTHWIAGEKPDEPVWAGAGSWDTEYDPGEWYHVVGVVDRASGQVAIYVNGEPKGTADFAKNAAAKGYEKQTWKIGIGSPGAEEWGWPARGAVDDVRIYNRALSEMDVRTLHEGK